MDNALRRLALLFALALPCHAQGILAPILFGTSTAPVAGTNIVRIGGVGKECGAGVGNTCTVTYDCASTSDRLAVFTLANGTSLSLSDTQGQAAGAYDFGHQLNGSWTIDAYNMGCASVSNTITITVGSGGVPFIWFAVREYSGIGSSGDGLTFTNHSGAVTSCSVSGTSTNTGDLEVVLQAAAKEWIQSPTTTPLVWVNDNGEQIPGNGNDADYVWSDNLYAPLGTVTYTGTAASSATSCYMFLIPGVPAASPGFYPQRVQSEFTCKSTPVTNPTFASYVNVQSGSVLTFDLQYNGNVTPISVVGSTCGAYTLRASEVNGTSNEDLVYTCKTASSGTETVTANGVFSGNLCGTTAEHSGLAGTVTDTGGLTTGATTMTWNQTVSNNLSLIHASCSSTGAGVKSISGTGYYPLNGGAFNNGGIASEAVVPTAGTTTPSLTFASSNANTLCTSIVLQ